MVGPAGREGEAGLVARAQANAERNGIRNAHFVRADLTTAPGPTLRYNKLLLDSPRTGVIEIPRRLGLSQTDIVVYR